MLALLRRPGWLRFGSPCSSAWLPPPACGGARPAPSVERPRHQGRDRHDRRGRGSTQDGAEARQPKTRSSTRRVALDTVTLSELAELRHEQDSLARSCGLKLTPDSFVFSFEPGGEIPPHPDNISHVFAKVRTKAEVAAGCPPPLAPPLPCHPDRLGDLRSSEAGPAGLVDRADGPSLHRRGCRGRSPSGRPHRAAADSQARRRTKKASAAGRPGHLGQADS